MTTRWVLLNNPVLNTHLALRNTQHCGVNQQKKVPVTFTATPVKTKDQTNTHLWHMKSHRRFGAQCFQILRRYDPQNIVITWLSELRKVRLTQQPVMYTPHTPLYLNLLEAPKTNQSDGQHTNSGIPRYKHATTADTQSINQSVKGMVYPVSQYNRQSSTATHTACFMAHDFRSRWRSHLASRDNTWGTENTGAAP